MELIAFVTEPASVKPILDHLGLPAEPLRVAPARGPPHADEHMNQRSLFDPTEPHTGFEFDQRVSW